MALQATEEGRQSEAEPPKNRRDADADADANPDHPWQPLGAPPSPPAGGEGCPDEIAVAGLLPDEIILEILSRLPVKPLFRFKCVSKPWLGLVDDCLSKIPPTMQGFLYGSTVNANYGHFFNLLGTSVPPVDPCFSFLTEQPEIERIRLLDSCNGLVLFEHLRCSEAWEELCFVVCNPATKEWVLVPSRSRSRSRSIGCEGEPEYYYTVHHYIFGRDVSSGFQLVQLLLDTDMTLVEVHSYSSESRVWGRRAIAECWSREASTSGFGGAFVKGMLHLAFVRKSDYKVVIVVVDGEWERRRVIRWPEEEHGSVVFLGQSQGLLHCVSGHRDEMTELSISVLADYDTEQWILKDTVSGLQLFGEVDCSVGGTTVAFHPDRNLVFFFHLWNRKLVSYDMDNKEVITLGTLDGWIPVSPYCPYFVESPGLVKNH